MKICVWCFELLAVYWVSGGVVDSEDVGCLIVEME